VPDPHPGDTDRSSATDAARLYGRWYYDTYTVPYEDNAHWKAFFGGVADAIVSQLAPRTVLDAGCAKGFLVAALRDRGVEATGFDLSDVAIAEAPERVRSHVRVGSLTDPIEGHYDLVTCIEVIEHLDPADAPRAVANLSAASDRLLFSSTPGDLDEPTHVNVQPPERWSQLLAAHAMFRDFNHDASYLSPWAVLYRTGDRSTVDVVGDYDRAWSQLRTETLEQRRALLDLQGRLEGDDRGGDVLERLRSDNEQLRKEVLRLRDAVVGKDAELGSALGRLAELDAFLKRYASMEQRLNDLLRSRSWRLMWAVGAPVRMVRRKAR
jgi:SAM-dependent methyltransferase